MHKMTSVLASVSLAALVLSGCAAAEAVRPVGLESSADVQRVQRTTETPAPEVMSDEEAAAFDELARAQAPLGDAVGLIEEQFPNDYAYAFFEVDILHVAFKGAAPAGAVAILEATGLPREVVESAGFNAAEYQAAMDSVSEQTEKYATEERDVQVGQDPKLEPGAILVSFLSDDKKLTADPGLTDSLEVDARFRVIFDFTETSPIADFEVFE
jgi:hypothetical protein